MSLLVAAEEIPGILDTIRNRLDPDRLPDEEEIYNDKSAEKLVALINAVLCFYQGLSDETKLLLAEFDDLKVEIEELVVRYLLRYVKIDSIHSVQIVNGRGDLLIQVY